MTALAMPLKHNPAESPPSKQGLKQKNCGDLRESIVARRVTSIKTRIETATRI